MIFLKVDCFYTYKRFINTHTHHFNFPRHSLLEQVNYDVWNTLWSRSRFTSGCGRKPRRWVAFLPIQALMRVSLAFPWIPGPLTAAAHGWDHVRYGVNLCYCGRLTPRVWTRTALSMWLTLGTWDLTCTSEWRKDCVDKWFLILSHMWPLMWQISDTLRGPYYWNLCGIQYIDIPKIEIRGWCVITIYPYELTWFISIYLLDIPIDLAVFSSWPNCYEVRGVALSRYP